jgi:hypothetical protein
VAGEDDRHGEDQAEPELAPERLGIVTGVLVMPCVAPMAAVTLVCAVGFGDLRLLGGCGRIVSGVLGVLTMIDAMVDTVDVVSMVVVVVVLVVPRAVAVGVVTAHWRLLPCG